MILETYYNIAEKLITVEGIRGIDLDKGQLENPELFESIIQPGILVNLPDTNYQEQAYGNQSADVTFSLKVVVILPNHTTIYAANSNLKAGNLSGLLIEDAVHQTAIKLPTVVRRTTKAYPVDTFFVVEHFYSARLTYLNKPRYHPHLLEGLPRIQTLIKLPL